MKMGETRVMVKLHGPAGAAEVEMLVDTGSTVTKIPDSVARKIGVVPGYVAEVELADGRVVQRGESEVVMELKGRRRTVPLLVGPDGEEPLLGLTALEIFRLNVNPAFQRLEPGRWREYELVV
jgi:clan AA aspartic protease